MISGPRIFKTLPVEFIKMEACHFVKGSVRVALVKGDLTAEVTDWIVNAANERLRHGGGLAAMIVKKGGIEIQEDSIEYVKLNGIVPTGSCWVALPGKLPCRQIIHAVGPIFNEKDPSESCRLLKNWIERVYIKSLETGIGSLSLTAISSGIFGYPKTLCAKDILSELTKVIEKHTGVLDYIRITIFDDPTFDAFYAEFKKYITV